MRLLEQIEPAGAAAAEALARFGHHPSAFLALNRETRHFRAPGVDGFIAYRRSGRWLFQIGSVFAAKDEQPALLAAFRRAAREERCRICAIELRPEDVPLYPAAGFRVNQLGLSYTLDLARFTTAGARFMQLRNKVKRARRAGVEAVEAGVETPRTAELWRRLEAVTAAWLAAKGRKTKLLEFMVGEIGRPEDERRRVFLAIERGEVVAFITYVPSFGRERGLMHDLSRQAPGAPPGVMELLNLAAIERFRADGVPRLHFGFTPFMGLEDGTDAIEGRSRAVSWILRKLARHGARIYPAASQAHYKLKWNPETRTPEYVAFEGRLRLGCLVRLLLLTRAV